MDRGWSCGVVDLFGTGTMFPTCFLLVNLLVMSCCFDVGDSSSCILSNMWKPLLGGFLISTETRVFGALELFEGCWYSSSLDAPRIENSWLGLGYLPGLTKSSVLRNSLGADTAPSIAKDRLFVRLTGCPTWRVVGEIKA